MDSSIMTFLPECPHYGRFDTTCYLCGVEYRIGGPQLTFWKCSNCERGVCGESYYPLPEHGAFDYARFSAIYPAAAQNIAPEHTPEAVAADFIEAVSSLKNKNYKAASIMARTALETAVNLRNAQGANLKQKIDDLAKQNFITFTMREWAHEIRVIGNDAAHDAGTVTETDSRDAINFAEMLFIYLFTLPGRIAERRGKRPV